jgi:hypothetical protein
MHLLCCLKSDRESSKSPTMISSYTFVNTMCQPTWSSDAHASGLVSDCHELCWWVPYLKPIQPRHCAIRTCSIHYAERGHRHEAILLFFLCDVGVVFADRTQDFMPCTSLPYHHTANPIVFTFVNLVWSISVPKTLNEKSLNCKVLDLVEHYNISLGCLSFQGCLQNFKNRILKTMNFQTFNTKWFKIKIY